MYATKLFIDDAKKHRITGSYWNSFASRLSHAYLNHHATSMSPVNDNSGVHVHNVTNTHSWCFSIISSYLSPYFSRRFFSLSSWRFFLSAQYFAFSASVIFDRSGSSSGSVDSRLSLKSVMLPVGPPPFLPFLAFFVASFALRGASQTPHQDTQQVRHLIKTPNKSDTSSRHPKSQTPRQDTQPPWTQRFAELKTIQSDYANTLLYVFYVGEINISAVPLT